MFVFEGEVRLGPFFGCVGVGDGGVFVFPGRIFIYSLAALRFGLFVKCE